VTLLQSTPPHLLAIIVLVIGALMLLALAGQLSDRPASVQAITVGTALVAAFAGHFDPSTRIAILGLMTTVAVVGLLIPTVELELPVQRPEAGALVLLGASGAVALATSADLLQLAVGLEVLSLSAVILIGMSAGRAPLEAAFRYFVLATVSLSSLLFGLGLVFLATGSVAFPSLSGTPQPFVIAGLVLIGVGVAFELALVPLHWGALDAYTAASPAIAGFVMAASKLAAALALGRLAMAAGVSLDGILVTVGVLSILWGTVGALAQQDLRRLLAYSAVVHAGFIALAAGSGADGRVAAAFYGLIYGAMALLAFAALSGRGGGPILLSRIRDERFGTWRSLALIVALLSLAGVPPTPGFWAKLAVLGPAWTNAGPWPTVLAVAGGVAGALYYLKPLPNLLATLRETPLPRPSTKPAMALAGLAVIVLGIVPGLAWTLATLAASGH
jgi:NADH-quinone oxidoreductase subunit N